MKKKIKTIIAQMTLEEKAALCTGASAWTIDGVGVCFNELGWDALNALDPDTCEGIFRELFAPGVEVNFTICRMPLGANDFSREMIGVAAATPGR